jgi:hypothetical protein
MNPANSRYDWFLGDGGGSWLWRDGGVLDGAFVSEAR